MPTERAALTLCSVAGPRSALGNASHNAQTVYVGASQHRYNGAGGLMISSTKRVLWRVGYRRSFLRAMNVIDLFPFLAGNKMPFKNKAKELNWPCLRSE